MAGQMAEKLVDRLVRKMVERWVASKAVEMDDWMAGQTAVK